MICRCSRNQPTISYNVECNHKDPEKPPYMSTVVIKDEYLDDRKDPLRIYFRDVLYRNGSGEIDRVGLKDRIGEGVLLVSFQHIIWSETDNDVYVGCTSCALPLNGQYEPDEEEVTKLQMGATFLHSSLLPLSTKGSKGPTKEAVDDVTDNSVGESNDEPVDCDSDGSIKVRAHLAIEGAD